MHYQNVIVGAGLAGLTIAERLANDLNEQVLIIDKREHIGGNVYDYSYNDIMVHKYGSHIFHTNNREVWNYLNTFTSFYPYQHKIKGFVDGQFIPIPFNLNSLYMLFPIRMAQELESILLKHYAYGSRVSIIDIQKITELTFLSQYIYEKIFLHYTLKQWQCEPNKLDSSVLNRVPIIISKDDRYFYDRFQGIPMQGYTKMCENMIDSKYISVQYNTKWHEVKNDIKYNRLFFCGAIDEFFDYEFGALPYRSLEFDFVCFEKEYFQGSAVVNYPNNYDYTRIGEYKYFLDSKSKHSVVSFEYPKAYSQGDERYYPIPNQESQVLYQSYKAKAEKLKNVYFVGRLGEYRYYDMDKVISRALSLFDEIYRDSKKK
ncbi:UDP-galactopyranose mutase [Helicobacter labetoulli]|uniref:UDP-galactopyranose mutase n=1 Tax=Helicobacter labetoulli TaxID=2315333 RepID=UPI000EF6E602|nr:UDP-galactopyranose mutase [Helicobacter labetoulli]